MLLTDWVLITVITLALLYAIYDEFIMDRLWGKTYVNVLLQRRNKLDSLIFIGLVAILLYQNVVTQGSGITTILLMSLAALWFYLFWLRRPKLLLKKHGFFYANIFIIYTRIKNMNLSEDGVLIIELENRVLQVYVNELDDLEHIYQFMLHS